MGIYDTVFTVGSETIKSMRQEKKATETIFLEAHEESRSEAIVAGHIMMITILPTGFGDSRENNEFVFVIDCSASMSGNRIRRAQECLQLFIQLLPLNSFFNVIRFDSTFEQLFGESG
jgi:hypothetical protein